MVTNENFKAAIITESLAGSTRNVFENFRWMCESWCAQHKDLEVVVRMPIIELPNGSTLTITSDPTTIDLKACDFIHTSELNYHPCYRDFIIEGFEKHQHVVMENTLALSCDNEHLKQAWDYDLYYGGDTPELPPFFIPWYVCDRHEISFKSHRERYNFEDELQEKLDAIGNPFPIPPQNSVIALPYELNRDTEWMQLWDEGDDKIYFDDYQMTLENINWYLQASKEFLGCQGSMNRSYPTFIEDCW